MFAATACVQYVIGMSSVRLPNRKRLDSTWWLQQGRVRDSQFWWLSVAGMLWIFGFVLSGMAQNTELTILQNSTADMSEALRARVDEARILLGELTIIVRLLDTLGVAIVGIQFARYLFKASPKSAQGASLSSRMFNDSPCAMVISDLQDVILDVNPAYERLTGYRKHEVVGMPVAFNHAGQAEDEVNQRMCQRLAEHGAWEGQFWLRSRAGEAFSDKVVRRTFHNTQTNTQCLLTVSLDSVGSEEEKRLMMWQAHHDTLTKLPNRNLFQERFARALMNLEPGSRGAVLSIDLDDFKIFNDSYGAAKGDQLLTQAAFRIALAVEGTQTVARMAGDHFAVLVEKIEDYADAERLARAILEQINLPYLEEEQEVTLTGSIGICVFPDDGSECGELLQRADAAQARVKAKGGNGLAFFESAMNEEAQRRLELVSALRKAIREDQLLLHFQPVIDLRDGSVTGAEALVRWQRPERGLIPPGVFIPVAEESGLIVELGAWVLRRVGRYLRECNDAALRKLRISVNVSAAQLADEPTRAALIELLKAEEAARLTLEITESALVADRDGVHAFLGTATKLGYRTALDDFGTGFSSLSYLRDFHFDVLKVDKSFVDNLQDARHFGLVASIVSMGRILGMQVVAEGVEEEAQVRKLRQIGCDYAQGYYYAKPLPFDNFIEFLSPDSLRQVS